MLAFLNAESVRSGVVVVAIVSALGLPGLGIAPIEGFDLRSCDSTKPDSRHPVVTYGAEIKVASPFEYWPHGVVFGDRRRQG